MCSECLLLYCQVIGYVPNAALGAQEEAAASEDSIDDADEAEDPLENLSAQVV